MKFYNAEYIERQAVVYDLNAVYNKMEGFPSAFYAGYQSAVTQVRNFPKSEVSPVRPELRKAVELLEKNYERGLNSEFVRDPLAWALYQTWKEIDGDAK